MGKKISKVDVTILITEVFNSLSIFFKQKNNSSGSCLLLSSSKEMLMKERMKKNILMIIRVFPGRKKMWASEQRRKRDCFDIVKSAIHCPSGCCCSPHPLGRRFIMSSSALEDLIMKQPYRPIRVT